MNIINLLSIKSDIVYLKSNTCIPKAMAKLRESGYSAVPVVNEDGTYAGIVSEGDFLWSKIDGTDVTEEGHPKKLQTLLKNKRAAAETINSDFRSVLMRAVDQNFVPIVDDRNMFIGIVTRKSVINYMIKKFMES